MAFVAATPRPRAAPAPWRERRRHAPPCRRPSWPSSSRGSWSAAARAPSPAESTTACVASLPHATPRPATCCSRCRCRRACSAQATATPACPASRRRGRRRCRGTCSSRSACCGTRPTRLRICTVFALRPDEAPPLPSGLDAEQLAEAHDRAFETEADTAYFWAGEQYVAAFEAAEAAAADGAAFSFTRRSASRARSTLCGRAACG